MDPWNCSSGGSETRLPYQEFDNCFEPAKPVCVELAKPAADKLPDSDLYINRLEAKLRKIESGRSPQSAASDVVLGRGLAADLSSAKEDALVRLVRSGSLNLCQEDTDLDTEVSTSYLYRRLAPHKTALTQGEKVVLLAADHLAKKLQEGGGEEENVENGENLEEDKQNSEKNN